MIIIRKISFFHFTFFPGEKKIYFLAFIEKKKSNYKWPRKKRGFFPRPLLITFPRKKIFHEVAQTPEKVPKHSKLIRRKMSS